MTWKSISEQIKEAEAIIETRYRKVARYVRRTEVVPFCRKYNMQFISGMGAYAFFYADGGLYSPGEYDSETQMRDDWLKVLKVLDAEIAGVPIGSWVADYKPQRTLEDELS